MRLIMQSVPKNTLPFQIEIKPKPLVCLTKFKIYSIKNLKEILKTVAFLALGELKTSYKIWKNTTQNSTCDGFGCLCMCVTAVFCSAAVWFSLVLESAVSELSIPTENWNFTKHLLRFLDSSELSLSGLLKLTYYFWCTFRSPPSWRPNRINPFWLSFCLIRTSIVGVMVVWNGKVFFGTPCTLELRGERWERLADRNRKSDSS